MLGSTVEIKNVNKFFGDFQVLKDINLEIKKGEFFSLLGPSGCGKTTLLRMIAGFDEPSAGDILLDNVNYNQVPSNKRPVNTIFQNYALFPNLSVFENVAFSLRLKKLPEQFIKEEVHKYLELVKLNDQAKKNPSQLSGGQKQRVSIARALINKPNVLLLDEPLSALDAKLRQQLLVELDTIHDEIGITFIYVTHDQQEALGVSDRIAVMNEGRVLQVGTSREIYEHPTNYFVANFIGETNNIEGIITEVNPERIIVKPNKIDNLTMSQEYKLSSDYNENEVTIGHKIKLSLRPEKIDISKEKPTGENNFNVTEGIIHEIIYNGFQSKIYVKVIGGKMLKVYRTHLYNAHQETVFNWKDKVYLTWNPDDAYIIEVE
jgi:spermidine/putrescine transport system ATP-binding protein